MAITCSICNKKQSGFIEDFPLSTELINFRICAKCKDNMQNMNKYLREKDLDRYDELRRYFESILESNNTDEQVSKYLEEFINNKNQNQYDVIAKQKEMEAKAEAEYNEFIKNFMMTTGYNFEGYKIKKYVKVITAECVLGTGFLSEFTSGFADFFGVESEQFNSKLKEARNFALNKLTKQAFELKANAVIGIDIDYTMFGKNMIGVIINGTAIEVEKIV